MTIRSNVIFPRAVKGWASREFDKGVASYDLNNLYSPDNAMYDSCVLDLASPKFDPNKTYAFDRNKYNNHGTITGATWGRLPSGLWVFNLDGIDDYIGCSSVSSIAHTGSVEAWVNHIVLGTPNSIVSNGSLGTDRDGFTMYIDGAGAFAFQFASAVAAQNTTVMTATAGFWNHLMVTWDGSFIIPYVNGVAGVSLAQTLDCGVANPVNIGRSGAGTAYYVQAKVGLVRLYNLALSSQEVASHYRQERHLFGV